MIARYIHTFILAFFAQTLSLYENNFINFYILRAGTGFNSNKY